MKEIIGKFFLVFATLAVICSTSLASDGRNMRFDLFSDVERIYYYVEYITPGIEVGKLPKQLQKDAIDDLAHNLITSRFSSSKCKNFMMGRNAYSCDIEKVLPIPRGRLHDATSGKPVDFATADEISSEDSLFIILSINISGNDRHSYDPPLQAPLLVYQVTLFRPNSDKIPLPYKRSFPSVMPLDQDIIYYTEGKDPFSSFSFGLAHAIGR